MLSNKRKEIMNPTQAIDDPKGDNPAQPKAGPAPHMAGDKPKPSDEKILEALATLTTQIKRCV